MSENDLVQGSAAWLAWRQQGCGASEVAAIMGLSPYQTKLGVFLDKSGRAKAFEGNLATMRGNELEAKARSLYELENMDTMNPAVAVHPLWPFIRASLDGISADGKTILEIKVPSQETHDKAKQGIVPEHYQIQIQTQLLVTGADTCHFFTYSPKDDSSALVVVKPDMEMQIRIVTEVTEFWLENVKKDVAPPHTERDVMDFDGNAEMEALVETFLAMKDNLDKKGLDEAKALLMKAAGHPKMKCGRVKLTAVSRNGKFSYHKLTLVEEGLDQTGS